MGVFQPAGLMDVSPTVTALDNPFDLSLELFPAIGADLRNGCGENSEGHRLRFVECDKVYDCFQSGFQVALLKAGSDRSCIMHGKTTAVDFHFLEQITEHTKLVSYVPVGEKDPCGFKLITVDSIGEVQFLETGCDFVFCFRINQSRQESKPELLNEGYHD